MSPRNRYSEAFVHALQESGIRNTDVVACLNNRVASSDVSNWRVGRRPIPAEHAPAIAALLNVAPEQISQAYERYLLAGYSAQGGSAHPSASQTSQTAAGHVVIERLESFGHFEGVSRIVMPEFLILPRTGLVPLSSIRWTVQPSIAMEPEIKRNALVLLDVTASEQSHVVDGGTYAYTLWGRPDIRRIEIRKDSWRLARPNSVSEHTVVSDSDLDHLKIFGAVVGWINPP